MFLSCVPWPKKGRKASPSAKSAAGSQLGALEEPYMAYQPYQKVMVVHVPFLQELTNAQHQRQGSCTHLDTVANGNCTGVARVPERGPSQASPERGRIPAAVSLSDASDLSQTSDLSVGSANLTVFSPDASSDGSENLTVFSPQASCGASPSCRSGSRRPRAFVADLPLSGVTRKALSSSTSKSSMESNEDAWGAGATSKPRKSISGTKPALLPKPNLSFKPKRQADGTFRKPGPMKPARPATVRVPPRRPPSPQDDDCCPPRPPLPAGYAMRASDNEMPLINRTSSSKSFGEFTSTIDTNPAPSVREIKKRLARGSRRMVATRKSSELEKKDFSKLLEMSLGQKVPDLPIIPPARNRLPGISGANLSSGRVGGELENASGNRLIHSSEADSPPSLAAVQLNTTDLSILRQPQAVGAVSLPLADSSESDRVPNHLTHTHSDSGALLMARDGTEEGSVSDSESYSGPSRPDKEAGPGKWGSMKLQTIVHAIVAVSKKDDTIDHKPSFFQAADGSTATEGQATPPGSSVGDSERMQAGDALRPMSDLTQRLSSSWKTYTGDIDTTAKFYSGDKAETADLGSAEPSPSGPVSPVSSISSIRRVPRTYAGSKMTERKRKLGGTRFNKTIRPAGSRAESDPGVSTTRRGVKLPCPPPKPTSTGSIDDTAASDAFQDEEDIYNTVTSCTAMMMDNVSVGSADTASRFNAGGAYSESDAEEGEYDMLDDSKSEFSSSSVTTQFPTTGNLVSVMEMRTLWRDLPAVQEGGYLEKLSSSEIKLQEAIYELQSSEESYNKSLGILVNFFIPKIHGNEEAVVEHPFCSKEDLETLVGNAEELLEISTAFLADVRLRTEDIVVESISDQIVQHLRSFESYVAYCRGQSLQNEKLCSLLNDPTFEKALRQLEQEPDAQKLPFTSYLLLPMQRITRLPLLLKAIVERTPDDTEEKKNIMNVMASAQQLVKRCNEAARSVELMMELDKKLHLDKVTPMDIIADHRILFHVGILRLVGNKRRKKLVKLYSFNDLVFIAKSKQDKKGAEELYVIDYCLTPFLMTHGSYHDTDDSPSLTFSIAFLENHEKKEATYVFETLNAKDMKKWMEVLHQPLYRKEDGDTIYHRWICPLGRALYSFRGDKEDDLAVDEGQQIEVYRRTEDGWCYGAIVGCKPVQEGWFPMSYIVDQPSEYRRSLNVKQRYHLLKAANF